MTLSTLDLEMIPKFVLRLSKPQLSLLACRRVNIHPALVAVQNSMSAARYSTTPINTATTASTITFTTTKGNDVPQEQPDLRHLLEDIHPMPGISVLILSTLMVHVMPMITTVNYIRRSSAQSVENS